MLLRLVEGQNKYLKQLFSELHIHIVTNVFIGEISGFIEKKQKFDRM
jgi:hypothetical protein